MKVPDEFLVDLAGIEVYDGVEAVLVLRYKDNSTVRAVSRKGGLFLWTKWPQSSKPTFVREVENPFIATLRKRAADLDVRIELCSLGSGEKHDVLWHDRRFIAELIADMQSIERFSKSNKTAAK